MKMSEKQKFENHIKNMIRNKEWWINTPKDKREKLLKHITKFLEDEVDELNEIFRKRRDWFNQGILFIAGIFVGLNGGLISNIVHPYLEKLGLFYPVITIIFFILSLWFVVFYIRNEAPGQNNKIYRSFVDHAKNILREREIK